LPVSPLRVVVLVSGEGTNLQALLDACADPSYGATVVAVGADRHETRAIARAEAAGVPTFVLRVKDFAERSQWDAALAQAVAAHSPGLVVLAGFMKLVGASNWFIQLPFVLEAVFAGLIGAIISFVVLAVAKAFLLDKTLSGIFTAGIIPPISWNDILLTLPLLLLVAAVISAVTGWVTLRFRLRT